MGWGRIPAGADPTLGQEWGQSLRGSDPAVRVCRPAAGTTITAALSLQFAYVYQAKPASRRGFHVTLRAISGPIPLETSHGAGRTLSIIKPDAVAKNVIGEIYARFEKAGLKVVAAKYKQLSRREAEGFYADTRERPFFNALVEFMISGPVMIQAWKARTPSWPTATCWAPPTRRKPRRAPSAPTSPNPSMPMPPTARTRSRMPRLRSPTSSPPPKSSRAESNAVNEVVQSPPSSRCRSRHPRLASRTCSTLIARAWRSFSSRFSAKKFRAHQVMKWIHHRYVTDFDE